VHFEVQVIIICCVSNAYTMHVPQLISTPLMTTNLGRGFGVARVIVPSEQEQEQGNIYVNE